MPELLHDAIHPAATIRDNGMEWDSESLVKASDRLANVLAFNGIVAGDRIAILMEKSAAAIVSIIAVLKACATYVPIDLAQPESRRKLILEQSRVSAIICSSGEPCQSDTYGIPVLYIDNNFKVDGGGKIPNHTLSENALAYILFTSGSTGVPKGVSISHRAAMAFVMWAGEEFALTPDDIVASHAGLGFDLSIFDIFVSLKAGSTISIVPKAAKAMPRELARWMAEEHITIIYTVPWTLMLLESFGGSKLANVPLRLILFAGEVFPHEKVRRLYDFFQDAKLYNLYGPTETNVCMFHEVKSEDLEQPLPIGLPCAGAKAIILDSENGELAVSGPGLFDGYFGLDEVDGGFIFCENGTKWYRTGDRVKLQNGKYVFLGRMDRMVKRRGYRIELGEIEQALHGVNRVAECAVVSQVKDDGKVVITAHVSPKELKPLELREFLTSKLPEYMMPDKIITRDFLPRTPTGKTKAKELETSEG